MKDKLLQLLLLLLLLLILLLLSTSILESASCQLRRMRSSSCPFPPSSVSASFTAAAVGVV
jgi:hypothetical protein